jgi:hypothetical protein
LILQAEIAKVVYTTSVMVHGRDLGMKSFVTAFAIRKTTDIIKRKYM